MIWMSHPQRVVRIHSELSSVELAGIIFMEFIPLIW